MPEAVDTRERILTTAAELWHSRSFDGVGVAAICAAADVRKGSFFHFFESKEDLLLAVIDHHWEQLRRCVFEPSFRTDIPPLARFERYFATLGAMLDETAREKRTMHGCPLGNVAVELGTRAPAVRERIASVFDRMKSVFQKTLREAVRNGEVPDDVDPPMAAGALVAFLQGLAVLGKTYDNPRLVGRLGRQAFAVMGIPRRDA